MFHLLREIHQITVFPTLSSISSICNTSFAIKDCGRPMREKTENSDLRAYVYGTPSSDSFLNLELYICFQVYIREMFSAELIGYSLKIKSSI